MGVVSVWDGVLESTMTPAIALRASMAFTLIAALAFALQTWA
jgi:hypothetical protein